MFKLMGKEINANLGAKISLSGPMLNWTYVKYHELYHIHFLYGRQYEQRHEISNNVVCATSKASDQPAHTHSLIRAFASCLNIQ